MITKQEKIEELRRELEMRKKVYPDSIRIGRLTQQEARRRCEVLIAIIKDYEGQGELFGGEGDRARIVDDLGERL